ncbi:histidine phosphatase family protein [Romeria aff. gracilis LEGE 07310]|uniref:phosphoglycerate mutase (2,3-diphosphoglycerate-dependent) n=1 Tax=Vasconcelosia minhoensis LEGE 07310 TaxID=915328 RepID=A0A8J7AUD5_9CYAN|nr:histidine phosphatase family protein [Romeria gracilis]MBE9076863.1 histidine phosphatase family protein [Romeria aff. gracilis LEGE 07310]
MTYLKLLLLRHAQSAGNAATRMEGQSSTALTPLGQQQAQRLSQVLYQQQAPPACFYTSPLLRAVQTLEALAQPWRSAGHDCPVYQQAQLQELHAGIFQGLTWAEAMDRHPDLCQRLMASLDWLPVPQAETLSAAHTRAAKWVRQILQTHQPGETVWAISHGGILQQIIAVLLGCDLTWKLTIPNTALFEFWLAEPGRTLTDSENRFNPEAQIIRRFNDCSHLQPLARHNLI